MANALAGETSPYLRQHSDNPVDWLPWGEQALARAREHDRPLLVSIGYSACHWCHVMERESFEDEPTAQLMNGHFVCVKVDREERPDVDALYMDAVQAMTGHGGWPLNVFLTPEQLPFYGGTYFPPQPRHGMPSWPQVLRAVAHAWETDRAEIRAGGERVRPRLAGAAVLTPSLQPPGAGELGAAVDVLEQSFDPVNAGFGGAPKFPPSPVLEFLLRRAAAAPDGTDSREGRMALATLRAMAAGGIHDQVGGGFARYSVDAQWIVPHFEKMLYDNALLARAYLHGWQLSGERDLLDACLGTLQWALHELAMDDGGFAAALDADSEGREGRFYVWTLAQLRDVLGDDAGDAIAFFGATERGNFAEPGEPARGENVLGARGPRPDGALLRSTRERLLAARGRRVRPARDGKRITSWNALMIGALAETGAVLSALAPPDVPPGLADELLDAAAACARFIDERLTAPGGRLLRTYNDGRAQLAGYLEDHAFLLEATIALYEATFDARHLTRARELAATIVAQFSDPERGGFFATAADQPALLARRKEIDDAPIPSGHSSAAAGLLRLAALTGEHAYEQRATGALALVHELAARHPSAFGHALVALDFQLARVQEVALVGRERGPLERVVRARLRPHIVLAAGSGEDGDGGVQLLAGRGEVGGRAAAYVCEGHACDLPVTEPEELDRLLR